ncbi:leukotriene B4 receptor 1-like [Leucoraja erinacea]|uniref:leukotriene B4 receptor 1-like n=1 Tax=Leucoraja erinaceus TaxID=7782 RepID=UPI0024583F9B|nr:leukotriene B4 receptor 1-like [Leucoraja erinacea]
MVELSNSTGEAGLSLGTEVRVAASIIFGATCLIGVPGNSIVIWVILSKMKRRPSTVLLILNLAIADLVLLLTLPLWIYSINNGWVFGTFSCKVVAYLIYCNLYGSVFFITLMSVDRFMAVIYPIASQRWRTERSVCKVVPVVWALACLFAVPVSQLMVVQTIDGQRTCKDYKTGSKALQITSLVMETFIGFVIPLTVLAVCYAHVVRRVSQMTFKSKNRTEMLIASIVIAFVICWLPYHVCNVFKFASLLVDPRSDAFSKLGNVSEVASYITGAIAFFSSAINPLLYAFAVKSLRDGFRPPVMVKVFEQMAQSTKDEYPMERFNNTKVESIQDL